MQFDKGALGLLGISILEEYGGFGKDFTTGMIATEYLGAGHSFSVAYAAHRNWHTAYSLLRQ